MQAPTTPRPPLALGVEFLGFRIRNLIFGVYGSEVTTMRWSLTGLGGWFLEVI